MKQSFRNSFMRERSKYGAKHAVLGYKRRERTRRFKSSGAEYNS